MVKVRWGELEKMREECDEQRVCKRVEKMRIRAVTLADQMRKMINQREVHLAMAREKMRENRKIMVQRSIYTRFECSSIKFPTRFECSWFECIFPGSRKLSVNWII